MNDLDSLLPDLYSQDRQRIIAAVDKLRGSDINYSDHTLELLAILVKALVTRDDEMIWGSAHALATGGTKGDAATLHELWRVLSPLFPDLNPDATCGWTWRAVGVAMISLVDQSECEVLAVEGDAFQRSVAQYRIAHGHDLREFWPQQRIE